MEAAAISCEARPMLGQPGCDHRQGYRLFLGVRIGWQCAVNTSDWQTGCFAWKRRAAGRQLERESSDTHGYVTLWL